MRAFYILLSGSIQLKSEALLRDEFLEHKKDLLSGVCRFSSFDPTKTKSTESLSPDSFPGIPVQILYELSTLLNLDPSDAYSLFLSYIVYEFKGTPEMIKLCFANENNLRSFFEKMLDYYHSERMFAIFAVKLIFLKPSGHRFADLLKDFAEQLKGELFESLRKQLERLERQKLFKKHSMMSYRFKSNAFNYRQSEISEILQVLVLYLHNEESFDPKIPQELLKMFTSSLAVSTGSGDEGDQQGEQQGEITESQRWVTFLKSLSVVLSLKPGLSFPQNETETHPVLDANNEVFRKKFLGDVLALDCKNSPEYSLIFLFWSAICFEVQEDSVGILAQRACGIDVWSWLDYCLQLTYFDDLLNSSVHQVISECIGQVLSLFFLNFNLPDEYILGDKSLQKLLYTVFKLEPIAKMFSLPVCGFHKVFISGLSAFPADYQAVLKWIEALAKTKEGNILFNSKGFCNSLDYFCEVYCDNSDDFQAIDNGTVLALRRRILGENVEPFGELEKDSIGELMILNGKR